MNNIKDPILFQSFKEYLTNYLPNIRAKSENTIKSYRFTINLYLKCLVETQNKTLCEITMLDLNSSNILAFLDWLKVNRGNSVATRNQRLAQLHGFCKYLLSNDSTKISELSSILDISKEPDPRKDKLEYLTVEQTKLLLELPNLKKSTGIRDQFFLTLMYDSGCRDQEILDLRVCDLIQKNNGAELHVIGKGSKYRVTPISSEVMSLFENYKSIYHESGKPEDLMFYTFRKQIRGKMSDDNVARFMNKYEGIIKKEYPDYPHIHPHLLRHTRAMHLYIAGMPLPLIAEWLGHTQLETTTIYAKATTEMKRIAAEKANSVATSVFKSDEKFKYASDEGTIKKLYGLE